MKKLWVYGDSNSEMYDSFDAYNMWSNEYIKWKGYVPKHYTQLIAEKFNCELRNFAKSGTNNHTIFERFCNSVNSISNDDIVIIQWTEPNRFRLVDDNNNWADFKFHNIQNKRTIENFKNVTIKTIEETLVNRLNIKYKEELESWTNLIKFALKETKLIIWSPFEESYGGNIVNSIETISIETNRLINDPHFSENGQTHLSNILIAQLLNTDKPII